MVEQSVRDLFNEDIDSLNDVSNKRVLLTPRQYLKYTHLDSPNLVDLNQTYNPKINDMDIVEDDKNANLILNDYLIENGIMPLTGLEYKRGNRFNVKSERSDPARTQRLNAFGKEYRIMTGVAGGWMNRENLTEVAYKAAKKGTKENKKLKRDVANSIYNLGELKEEINKEYGVFGPFVYHISGLAGVEKLNKGVLEKLDDPKYLIKIMFHEKAHREKELSGFNNALMNVGGSPLVEGDNVTWEKGRFGKRNTIPGTTYDLFGDTYENALSNNGHDHISIYKNFLAGGNDYVKVANNFNNELNNYGFGMN